MSVGNMADDETGAPVSDEEKSEDGSISAEEESDSEDSMEEELFEVEHIVGMKKNANGVKLYKVRWKNYSKEFDSWEPVENLESCLDIVEEYEEEKEREKKKRSDERKKRMAIMAGRQTYEGTVSIPAPSRTISTSSGSNSPQVATTLKDTFWKDLEEGKINLFNTDMYSRVKGQGRASRPKSFKRNFRGAASTPDSYDSNDLDEFGSGDDIDSSLSRTSSTSKKSVKQKQHSLKGKSKRGGGTGTGRVKGTLKGQKTCPSACDTSESSSSSDSSEVISSRGMSVSTPSPPVLSCVEDYSDDGGHDMADDRYSLPADITGSLPESPVPVEWSRSNVSDDIGIEMDSVNSPLEDQIMKTDSSSKISYHCTQKSHTADLTEETKVLKSCEKLETVKSAEETRITKPKVDTVESSSRKSESKSGKKIKHSDSSYEVQKNLQKKLKLDSEIIKQRHRNKSTKDSSSGSTKDGCASSRSSISTYAKTGKENQGEPKHVANIFTGLSSVLAASSKSRSPSVHTVSRTDSATGQGIAVCEANKVTCKRKDSTPPTECSQPLDKILSSSPLLPILPDKMPADKGLDLAFDIDLDDIDLDELEKQLTMSPSDHPLELNDDELKQAVLDGDYSLVKRAFAARNVYDIEQPDAMGTTLLMQAILRNFDDIAEVLVCSGAKINAQQKNGNTSLMIASEQAHICTVALLIEMGANVNTQQTAGETALMKAVKRGHKQIIRYLLENGANFSYLTYNGYSALSYAKLLRLPDVEELIVDHVSRLTAEFDRQVAITLNNTAQIISALFPLQCFPLAESDKFVIPFKNEVEPITPGVGFLLFIAHARITPHEIKCRFYGPCAVKSVFLNGVKQPSLTEEANFVLSCHPVLPGKNELCIHTEAAVSSKAKLVVCAYKAQLIQ